MSIEIFHEILIPQFGIGKMTKPATQPFRADESGPKALSYEFPSALGVRN